MTDVALWKQTTANTDIPTYISVVCESGGASAGPGTEDGFMADQEAFAKPTADRFLADRLQQPRRTTPRKATRESAKATYNRGA